MPPQPQNAPQIGVALPANLNPGAQNHRLLSDKVRAEIVEHYIASKKDAAATIRAVKLLASFFLLLAKIH